LQFVHHPNKLEDQLAALIVDASPSAEDRKCLAWWPTSNKRDAFEIGEIHPGLIGEMTGIEPLDGLSQQGQRWSIRTDGLDRGRVDLVAYDRFEPSLLQAEVETHRTAE
jgi:hypothetical protein